jgi:hypothetical protein
MKVRKDEVIYEWGKSLIRFRGRESSREQLRKSRYIGWDPMMEKGFQGSKKTSEVNQKVGGGKDWTAAGKGGSGLWEESIVDYSIADQAEAEGLAMGRLQKLSYGYVKGDGAGEGNPDVIAGMRVTVKGAGVYTGEYIAERVTHSFDLRNGYITSFGLKRNMLEGASGKQGGVPAKNQARNTAGNGGGRQGEIAAAAAEEEQEAEEAAKTPELINLRWEKDGKGTGEALVEDKVFLCFDVRNINNGEGVKITVWEHDGDNEHDHVADLEGVVENGQVRKEWAVVYTEDNDDSASGKELAEQGYTLPEYHFVAEYNGTESGESPVLEVKGWVELILEDHQSKESLVNRKYTIFLENGEKIEGITDEKGNVNKTGLVISDRFIMIHEE